jgi:proteasome lid subunit RPN8/RPN11
MRSLSDFWNAHLERCGFLLRDGRLIEVPNIHEEPQLGFRVNPEDILNHETDIVATWHTHPHDGPNLSVADYRCFLNWPEWTHLIVHRGKVWAYYVEQNRVLLHDDFDLSRIPGGAIS